MEGRAASCAFVIFARSSHRFLPCPSESNEDLVRQFLATAEEFYGVPPPERATFEVQEVSGELHAEWDKERSHGTIRIQPGWDDYQRNGRLAHESFHVFSPATLS